MRVWTRSGLVLGLSLMMMAMAPVRPTFGRSARMSPCHRASGKHLAKRCVTKRKLVRRTQRGAWRPAQRRVVVAVSSGTPSTGPGWVNIESRPGTVRVYINGQKVGLTPLQIRLTEGRHTLEAVRDDGVRQRRIIDIEPGQQRRLILVS